MIRRRIAGDTAPAPNPKNTLDNTKAQTCDEQNRGDHVIRNIRIVAN